MGGHTVVLVTGASGQVGSALSSIVSKWRFASHSELDVRDQPAVSRALDGISTVIHLAALTDVDLCEREPRLAFDVNAAGTHNVVSAARSTRTRVIYMSTDYVFDGEKTGPYAEHDSPDPINQYGRSKLEGERAVLAEPTNLVIRTSWIYGGRKSFVSSILSHSRRTKMLKVVDDQVGRPSWAKELAESVVALSEMDVAGILHISGAGPSCSRAEWAREILKIDGGDTSVEGVDSSTYAAESSHLVAPRPRNSLLDLSRAQEVGLNPPDWRESLRLYLRSS